MTNRRQWLAAALSATALVLTGCASLPSPDAMKADIAGFQLPQQPPEGRALVYVVRPSSLGALIRFNVFLDDKEADSEMGWTRGSQYIWFSVPPGEHRVYSKAENWAEAQISVKAGDVVFIHQEPQMGIIMARNTVRTIEAVEGTYHVKNLKLGTVLKTSR